MNIASGSSGNAAYVGDSGTHLLIDAGISKKRIIEGLNRLELTLNDLSAILITHEHSDHVSSLRTLLRSVHIPVYATRGTIGRLTGIPDCEMSDYDIRIIQPDVPFSIKNLNVTAFRTCHDAGEPVCYRFDTTASSCGIITDLGCFDDHLIQGFQNVDTVVVESNHDRRMLETGPYPYPLKRRIAGSNGHLSNDDSALLIRQLLHDELKNIVLGHLSRKNNYPDLARMTLEESIDYGSCKYHSGDFRIDVAKPDCSGDIYEF